MPWFLLVVSLAAGAAAVPTAEPAARAALRDAVVAAAEQWPPPIASSVVALYEARQWAPAWSDARAARAALSFAGNVSGVPEGSAAWDVAVTARVLDEARATACGRAELWRASAHWEPGPGCSDVVPTVADALARGTI